MEISKIENYNSISQVDTSLRNTHSSYNNDNKFDDSITKAKQKSDIKELNSAVNKANKVLFKNNTHLQFRIHERTKEVMVKIINDESGEVLREIPPEKMLDMVAKLWEIAGIIVDEKV